MTGLINVTWKLKIQTWIYLEINNMLPSDDLKCGMIDVTVLKCLKASCKSENLNEEDALRLQLETHAVSPVVQEVLQPQELHPT